MVKVSGAKVDIKCLDGILLKDVHRDWVILLPDEVEDVEANRALVLAPPKDNEKPSPGQMVEAVPSPEEREAAKGVVAKGRLKGSPVGSTGGLPDCSRCPPLPGRSCPGA